MARLPNDLIDRLKAEVSLERLVTASGVELRRHGADLVGRCPMHDDRGPSLVISPKKNLWHCLGACRAGGSVIDWVMKTKGVSFRHAVELLRADGGAVAPARMVALPSPVEASAEDQEVLRQVVAYYHEALKQSPEALGYLEQRGLQSPDMIERFQLGFSNRTLGYRLPSRAARERLQALGILRESGHEHFNGSLVIPVFGDRGEVLGMYGRKVTPAHKLRKGTPLHLYLPGPRRGVFNAAGLESGQPVILCEALIDALTFWCAGYRNVTASYGIEGFTADHLATFERAGTSEVLIAYDRDEAGERAAMALAEDLIGKGFTCWRLQFPRGMDANEYACKVTPAAKSLGVVVRNAVWLGKGQPPGSPLDVPSTPHAEPADEPLDDAPQAAVGAALARADAPSPSSIDASLAAKEEDQALPGELRMSFGDRRYRIRGLDKNLSFGQLRVNVLVARDEALHVDTLDLYSARHRAAFVKQAAIEIGSAEDTVKRDMGRLLLKLEELQEQQIKATLTPQPADPLVSDEDRGPALDLLQDPHLLDRILADFEACGVVGEHTNKLLGYLAAVSRLLDEPLAVIVQSASAAGKSSLMESILAFVPEEARVKYSAMTGQSLFYMGETNLRHKVLAIVEEQGAERATYALKLLQSEGELTIASTGKDPATGRMVTQEYRVEGPVMIFLTTTAIEIDEELLNRCLVLTVDEDREQTRAIHRLQRERQTLDGLLRRQSRRSILEVHRNAQRLLKPLLVVNPFAEKLTFLDDRTRTRRDHVKYLTLIRVVALLHQYQRPLKTVMHRGEVVPYIEVTLDDIAVANRLAHQVLGRSLDELAPQTRRLLLATERMVREGCERDQVAKKDFLFSRRQLREYTGWSNTQVHVHLSRLVELEYVIAHRGRGQGFEYELVYDGGGQDGTPFLSGLIDVEALTTAAIPASEADTRGGFGVDSGRIPATFPSLATTTGLTEALNRVNGHGNAHLDVAASRPTVPA